MINFASLVTGASSRQRRRTKHNNTAGTTRALSATRINLRARIGYSLPLPLGTLDFFAASSSFFGFFAAFFFAQPVTVIGVD